MWNVHWFMRAVRWARNPPSAKQVIFVFGLLAILLAIAGIEKFVGWPDMFTAERAPKRIKITPVEPTE